jgi:hypothetical protein
MDKKTINRLIRHISHGQNKSKRIHAETYRLDSLANGCR